MAQRSNGKSKVTRHRGPREKARNQKQRKRIVALALQGMLSFYYLSASRQQQLVTFYYCYCHCVVEDLIGHFSGYVSKFYAAIDLPQVLTMKCPKFHQDRTCGYYVVMYKLTNKQTDTLLYKYIYEVYSATYIILYKKAFVYKHIIIIVYRTRKRSLLTGICKEQKF